MSNTRKWGAKEHLERTSIPDSNDPADNSSPLDWVKIYREEAAAMQKAEYEAAAKKKAEEEAAAKKKAEDEDEATKKAEEEDKA